ncbi:metallophosphoesterase family protein [Photobacterium lutimaris]|uniref:Phosphoesterase n=1 Tax=Photobacterium lutimaris TaxID=388278 RepID=A0A2T3J512_9GAMM|nr:metallophosphoesterase [Photobacterium lutimaris]PSU36365.1 phosphoesterase [Photobacterium lutimaris]TDR74738.1 calcineurin-like phosphoesterase family protein [Photobacterium lutimaris]
MKRFRKSSVALLLSMSMGTAFAAEEVQVAFMPDIHFHDVYGDFTDGSFDGLKNSHSGQQATIRSMHAQLTSTRLFNENYFALLAALDDAVKRGVKYIALPGDFSDDGQPVHIRGLKTILDYYADTYDLEFFAAPGNHDPVRPFDRPSGEGDFLGKDGKTQRIFSKGANECVGYDSETAVINAGHELPTICTEEIRELGYEGLMAELGDFGFFPQPSNLYWETPYSSYSQANYAFDTALAQSKYGQRQYEICHQGTGGQYKQPNYSACFMVPDTSYLVEPVEGLWLLAIDANVYIPGADADTQQPELASNFAGSGNAGYNKMLTHKQHVIEWMKTVVDRANAEGKTLVAFSHFPMTEFYNGAAETIEDIFGPGNFQLARSPKQDVSEALAKTGIRLHVGGHMHFNDTGVKHYGDGSFLFNIQAPSMAAYVPAYKLLTFSPESQVEVETVILDKVPRFDELFEHYEEEWKHLKAKGNEEIWNKDVLTSKDYYEFTNWHITELTRMRFLPEEWPCDLKQMVFALDGRQMLTLSQLDSPLTQQQVTTLTEGLQAVEICQETPVAFEPSTIKDPAFAKAWQQAEASAKQLAAQNNLTLDDFSQWNGFDLAVDFYRLRNADELAFKDIDRNRMPQYELLANTLAEQAATVAGSTQFGDVFKQRFGGLFGILTKFANGQPSYHFKLDLDKGTISDLKR